MSNKLDDKHAIQSRILYLVHSIDGKPVRYIFPMWKNTFPKQFKESWDTYVHGKIDPATGKRSEKNCHTHVMNILDRTFKPLMDDPQYKNWTENYKKLHDLISPVPFDGKDRIKNTRSIYAYGMYAALSSGMTLDYPKLIEKVENITNLLYTNPSRGDREMNKLILELKQTNFIASMLASPSYCGSEYVHILDALTLSEKEIKELGPGNQSCIRSYTNELKTKIKNPNILKMFKEMTKAQRQEILAHLEKLTFSAADKVHENVEKATKIIESGKFLLPRSDEMVKEVVIDNALTNIVNSLNALPDKNLNPRQLIDAIARAGTLSFNQLESVTNIEEPSPNASLGELRKGSIIYDKEAQAISNEYINTNSSNEKSAEVATLYDAHQQDHGSSME